jgi:FMN phosphatase YigB (HAD superfamily)
MTSPVADERPVLVLDFDGTVCVGDAPVWAYAEAALDVADAHEEVRVAVRAGLGAYLSGAPESPVYADGYAAVAKLLGGIATREQLDAAFHASRRALADGEVPVATPPGLDGFLRGLAGEALRVLVTNAPAEGVHETLLRLGIADAVDLVLTEAGKPAGWATILPDLLAGRDPARLLSVGDIWRNDLEQPLAAGCGAALIDRFGQQSGAAHLTAPLFEDLYDDLAAWVRDPEGFLATHPAGSPTSPSRTNIPPSMHRTGTT